MIAAVVLPSFELQAALRSDASAEREWGRILRRLEAAGFAVETVELGAACFDTREAERRYGGLEQVLKLALVAVGPGWDARAGAAVRPLAALAAAGVAAPGQALVVSDRNAPRARGGCSSRRAVPTAVPSAKRVRRSTLPSGEPRRGCSRG